MSTNTKQHHKQGLWEHKTRSWRQKQLAKAIVIHLPFDRRPKEK